MKLTRMLGFGVAIILGTAGSAAIIPSFTSETTVSGISTYSYDVQLDSLENLITGNQLCIAGITGLTGTPSAAAGWTAADSAGACPIAAGTSSPNVGGSVLYTYTGNATISGPFDFGNFSFQSTNSVIGVLNDAYGAIAQKKSNLSIAANQGELNGPVNATLTPEPATLSLLGAGLVGLGMLKRRRAVIVR